MGADLNSKNSTKARLPTKWAILFFAAIAAYALLQPLANARLGWNLPSLQSLREGGQAGDAQPAETRESPRGGDWIDIQDLPTSPAADRSQSFEVATSPGSAESGGADTLQSASNASAGEGLRYGSLKSLGRDEYLSPAGLRYTPMGGPEKHRLEHIKRHLRDQPTRPGKHGVFDGDMPQVLRWLDEAYTRSRGKETGTRIQSQGDRDVYEVTFSKPIGYVGGRDGKRAGNPDARKLRMVLEGQRVITAFPF